MQRVIDDVKSIQRENNSLIGKTERTFTVTDETIFRVSFKSMKIRLFNKSATIYSLNFSDGTDRRNSPPYLQISYDLTFRL